MSSWFGACWAHETAAELIFVTVPPDGFPASDIIPRALVSCAPRAPRTLRCPRFETTFTSTAPSSRKLQPPRARRLNRGVGQEMGDWAARACGRFLVSGGLVVAPLHCPRRDHPRNAWHACRSQGHGASRQSGAKAAMSGACHSRLVGSKSFTSAHPDLSSLCPRPHIPRTFSSRTLLLQHANYLFLYPGHAVQLERLTRQQSCRCDRTARRSHPRH